MSAASNLCTLDHNNFTRLRPFIGLSGEPGTHRILTHVLPFLAVTLVIAQHMIEKSRLPKRTFFGRAKGDGNCSLQSIDPLRKIEIITASDKEMHVIRHDHIPSYCHIKLVPRAVDTAFECALCCA